jgi:hypothetical protein
MDLVKFSWSRHLVYESQLQVMSNVTRTMHCYVVRDCKNIVDIGQVGRCSFQTETVIVRAIFLSVLVFAVPYISGPLDSSHYLQSFWRLDQNIQFPNVR